MARWVDVRIVREDASRAINALLDSKLATNLVVDPRPPSGAPGEEWQLSIQDHSAAAIVVRLRAARVTVLAFRERLDEPARLPPVTEERELA